MVKLLSPDNNKIKIKTNVTLSENFKGPMEQNRTQI